MSPWGGGIESGPSHAVDAPVSDTSLTLQRLDAALRVTSGFPPRPYELGPHDVAESSSFTYSGPALTPQQEAAARAYIDFIRTPAKTV